MQKIIHSIQNVVAARQNEVLALLRLSLGVIYIQAGLGKFVNFEKTVGFFISIGIPFPEINVVFSAGIELIAGVCILIGLMTRLVSLPLAFVMVIAIITGHRADIHSFSDLFALNAWIYLVILLLLATIGSGKWSLDHFLLKK